MRQFCSRWGSFKLNTRHNFKAALAAILAAALAFAAGTEGARQLLHSQAYQSSRIISTILRQDAFELPALVENRRNVVMLARFLGAAAAAYIDFELIPVDEAATFAAVFESVPPGVEIDGFAYRGNTLEIDGIAPGDGELEQLEQALRSSGRFTSVERVREVAADGGVAFRLDCFQPDHRESIG